MQLGHHREAPLLQRDRFGVGHEQPARDRSRATSSSLRYPKPARASPAVRVDFPEPDAPGEEDADAGGVEGTGMEEQVLAAGLGRGAVHVPHEPAQGVAGLLARASTLSVRTSRRRCRRPRPRPSASTTARPVPHRKGRAARPARRRPDSQVARHRQARAREVVRQTAQVLGAMRPAVLVLHRCSRVVALSRRRPLLLRTTGPVVHRPSPGDQRHADHGVTLDVEVFVGQLTRRLGGGRRGHPARGTRRLGGGRRGHPLVGPDGWARPLWSPRSRGCRRTRSCRPGRPRSRSCHRTRAWTWRRRRRASP